MKISLEADFVKGSGTVRWEGVTAKRVKRLIGVAVLVVGSIMLTMHRF